MFCLPINLTAESDGKHFQFGTIFRCYCTLLHSRILQVTPTAWIILERNTGKLDINSKLCTAISVNCGRLVFTYEIVFDFKLAPTKAVVSSLLM